MDIVDWLQFLVRYLAITLQLSAVAMVASVPVAGGLALCRLSPWRPVRVAARAEVDLLRSIPLLALLLFLYFGAGPFVAFMGTDSAFWLAALGLTLTESAYIAEVYRAALEAVPVGQWDAAASIGLGWRGALLNVIIPEAIPASIPPTVNLLVSTIKGSSLASLIAVNELTLGATVLVSNTFMPMQVYLLVGVIYLVLVVPISYLAQYSEGFVARRFGLVANLDVLHVVEVASKVAQ